MLSLQAAPAKWTWQSPGSRSWPAFSDQKEKRIATLLATWSARSPVLTATPSTSHVLGTSRTWSGCILMAQYVLPSKSYNCSAYFTKWCLTQDQRLKCLQSSTCAWPKLLPISWSTSLPPLPSPPVSPLPGGQRPGQPSYKSLHTWSLSHWTC